MKDFINYLVQNLVDAPDQVRIEEEHKDKQILLHIHVAQKDLARVIGRKGKNINALRTIASALGARFDRRVILQLVEDGKQESKEEPKEEAASSEESELCHHSE